MKSIEDLIGKRAVIQFAQPARVQLDQRKFRNAGLVRVDAVDGKIVAVGDGYITIETTGIYTPDHDEPFHPDDMGVPQFHHDGTLMHPIKHLGSIQVL